MGNLTQRLSILGVGIIAGAVITTCSEAATFSGNSSICQSLAQHTYTVAQMRDAGVPWQQFEAWLRPQLDEAIADPTTFTKSQEDVNYIMGLFKRIYDQPGKKAEDVPAWAYEDCMKVQPASFKRGKLSV